MAATAKAATRRGRSALRLSKGAAIERVIRISTPWLAPARAARSEPVDRAELELPAGIGSARRLAEIGVADDADVAVRRVVLVVEQVEDIRAHLDALPARQRERSGQRHVRVADRSAARGVAAVG